MSGTDYRFNVKIAATIQNNILRKFFLKSLNFWFSGKDFIFTAAVKYKK